MPSSTRKPRLPDSELDAIRGRCAFYREWAGDVYEATVYGTDDRRALVAEVDRLRVIETAARAWADLCHDYDLNERGQALMAALRNALED